MAGNKKKRAIRLLVLALVEDDEDEVQADRRFWVRPFIAKGFAMGAYQHYSDSSYRLYRIIVGIFA